MIHHPLTQWLIFNHSKYRFSTSITQLLEHYRDPESFLKDKIKSINEKEAINWKEIEQALIWQDHEWQTILPYTDKRYPTLLRHIPNPPPILYIKGNYSTLNQMQLAIVGSRQASHSGQTITRQFSHALVEAGLTITSGLAAGIDACAHEAAVLMGGPTIAVLGNGLHEIYPRQNKKLADQICEHGCLVSEFALNAPPNKKHFPQRNRIISGLSVGTLVVEAKRRSGSLITARLAGEQGREVFAIPGSIRHSLSQGCHQLIRDGAILTESVRDILDTLNIPKPAQLHTNTVSASNKFSRTLDPQQQQLLACVDYEVTSIEEIIERSQMATTEVSRQLLSLELEGYVNSTPRGYMRIK